MLAVSGIDALRRIAEKEIASAGEPRHLLERRSTDILGHAGIDGALEDDDAASAEALADGLAGAQYRAEVGLILPIDGGGYGHDEDVAARQFGIVRGRLQ